MTTSYNNDKNLKREEQYSYRVKLADKIRSAILDAPDDSFEINHIMERILYLRDPRSLHGLLDEFQSHGVPMGYEDWARYAHLYLQGLKEIRTAYNHLRNALREGVSMDRLQKMLSQDPESFSKERILKMTNAWRERKEQDTL